MFTGTKWSKNIEIMRERLARSIAWYPAHVFEHGVFVVQRSSLPDPSSGVEQGTYSKNIIASKTVGKLEVHSALSALLQVDETHANILMDS